MAETSTKQAALTRDTAHGGFMERLAMEMVNTAAQILGGESATTLHHAERAAYSQRVIADPNTVARTAGPAVAMGQYVIAATVYDEATQSATCTISDNDLLSQLYALWNTLAGIDQGA